MRKRLFPIIFSLVITSLCLFASAGRFDWPNAWVLLGINLAAGVVRMIVLWNETELQAERSNVKAGKSWDKALVGFVVLFGPVATWVTAGLDTRFHWSNPMPQSTFAAGLVIAALSSALLIWAMKANTFFSAVVRIQKDRGHSVVTGGPYAYVRHPGYTGMALFTLVTPWILNSRWAFVPAIITAGLGALRTALEDRTLQAELEGYGEYARSVRFKLLPAIW